MAFNFEINLSDVEANKSGNAIAIRYCTNSQSCNVRRVMNITFGSACFTKINL